MKDNGQTECVRAARLTNVQAREISGRAAWRWRPMGGGSMRQRRRGPERFDSRVTVTQADMGPARVNRENGARAGHREQR